jgi:hypothetical protein
LSGVITRKATTRLALSVALSVALVAGLVFQLAWAVVAPLGYAANGTPGTARGTGHDALWLGHAWVDGRRSRADVDALADRLRGTGIKDLFVHSGPLRDDGSLDPAMRPRSRWVVAALHKALPGVRVQAWLGAHPTPAELHLWEQGTRDHIITAVGQVLDEGFDGVHFDFEPVSDGDPDLLQILDEAHTYMRNRNAILSVSASHTEPATGMAAAVTALPGRMVLWSPAYLQRVSLLVEQVAVMSYDTALPFGSAYTGYLRRATTDAIAAVAPETTLFMGVPAYHDENPLHHRRAETVANALHGIRLALGDSPPADRTFGVALYVDFAATESDWTAYRTLWS